MNDIGVATISLVSQAATDPRSLRRFEDERFLTGRGQYQDDEQVPGALHAVVLRSPHAHAEILAVDVAAAKSLPGVCAIYTAAEIDDLGPLPCSLALKAEPPLIVPPRFPLARGRVRHVGDPVAFVVAESVDAARQACELIAVDYEILPAVTELAATAEPGAPVIWPEAPGNLALRYRLGDDGAVASAFRRAAHVVTCRLVNNRITAAALEPRVALGRFDAQSGRYRLSLSGASVHDIRRELGLVLRVGPEQIDVTCPDVGGGFGMKNVTYPEYALVLIAAERLGRQVRWLAERIEDFAGGAHARDNLTTGRLALDAHGRFLALAVETIANLGAYVSSLGPGSSTTAPTPAMGGLYDIPAMSMDVRCVFTNTAPVDAYRGAGKPEANYLIERLADEAAHLLRIDPAVLRKRNFIRSFPYRKPFGAALDCGAFTGNLERVLAAADRAGFRRRRAASRRRGMPRGFGIGCFLETARGGPNEDAWLSFRADGRVEMAVGTQSNGQGHETSFAQVLSQQLGLSAEHFHLVQGDTARVPTGGGHGGARSLHMGGGALVLAARALIRAARPAAAELLQAPTEAVIFRDGWFRAPGAGEVALAAVARHIGETTGRPLSGHGAHRDAPLTFPNGAQTAEVEIDPETGAVTLLRYVAVDDYGILINPLLTEAQVHGGLAQGIGQALMEEIRYDPEGGQLLSATFMDYALPRAADLPCFELSLVELPTTANPLGVKGAGQAGCIGAPQTVIHAILDALRPLGVSHIDMPATPARIWHAIRAASEARTQP
ncbi:xanthine dehydrogenase family protein molybdopterin-binding subunit [Bosea sp. BIWAKO-01]|uniref:xanthine dehydrogenase family protein molybdopterin-binding subunit n=1 Tax=Bosea sp. BIWAKO-01 TaxID=506668 RepID=UPI000868545E|nr:xanthine dehydrogenase family protein molybdopterin-binding subunit [Bosea sp. BIWAKO-01]GAU86371.1 carbon monoxide dehydrogenase large chain [Bosea sp. BIWAKO-01]